MSRAARRHAVEVVVDSRAAERSRDQAAADLVGYVERGVLDVRSLRRLSIVSPVAKEALRRIAAPAVH